MDGTLQSPAAQLPNEHLDALTGLPNRAWLEDALRRALNDGRPATLALLQLENFYEIRSWVGKSDASFLLSDIARLLQHNLPEGVMLCRCENYEFVLLLRNENSVNARPITDRIKQALQSAVSESIPPQLELKCAVGLAASEPGVTGPEVLFARARHQLSVALFRRHGEQRLSAMHEVDGFDPLDLAPALERQPLALNFQPIVSLMPDGVERYEVRCQLPPRKGPPRTGAHVRNRRTERAWRRHRPAVDQPGARHPAGEESARLVFLRQPDPEFHGRRRLPSLAASRTRRASASGAATGPADQRDRHIDIPASLAISLRTSRRGSKSASPSATSA